MMGNRVNDTDMSSLEFELESDSDDELYRELDEGDDNEHEHDDSELEAGDDEELDEGEDGTGGYAERFYELAQRELESSLEIDREVNRLLTEMEREFFSFGSVFKKLKSAGKGLLKKGLDHVKKRIPITQLIEGVTQLSRGNLKGMLAPLAKAALSVAGNHPAIAALMPALKSLGFDPDGDEGQNREAWDNYVNLAREAYDELATNLTRDSDEPIEASRVATKSFQNALSRVAQPGASVGVRSSPRVPRQGGNTRVIELRKGERLVVRVR
jgi:hypothetical protein